MVILRCTLPPPLIDHLFAIGAAGYLPAEPPADTSADQWLAAAADKTAVADADDDPLPLAALLSPRELEVVRLIGLGQSTRTIAATLYLSVKTIESNKSRIKSKLGLDSPTALAQWAWRFVQGAGVP